LETKGGETRGTNLDIYVKGHCRGKGSEGGIVRKGTLGITGKLLSHRSNKRKKGFWLNSPKKRVNWLRLRRSEIITRQDGVITGKGEDKGKTRG